VLFSTRIGQSGRPKWKQAARVSLAIVLLSAVVVAGFSLLGSEVLAAWKASTSTEPQLASGGAFAGLVNFEAPAATVARFEATATESEKSSAQTSNAPLLAKSWKSTQNPIADAFQLSWTAFFQGNAIRALDQFIDSLPLSPQVQMQFTEILALFYQLDIVAQAFANSFLPAAFRSPPLPPASPTL
jgi:hypothetical protein